MAAAAIAPEAAIPTEHSVAPAPTAWPLWQRVLFRFFFVYLLLQITPWFWFDAIPGVPFVLRAWQRVVDWAVTLSNARIFHVREVLVPVNGSGDTSYSWTQVWLYLSLAVVACVAWSVLDRRRQGYDRLLYWLRTIVRYYLATFALSYGIIKLFALQMPFPTLSQLATPLGDLLPMRFSWLFIGYSFKYQFFSGMMETVAGLLLLYRRTVTAGLFAAMGAFLNVVMINLSYDVPVKLFSMHLFFCSVFLLALDARRVLGFMLLNQAVPPTNAWQPRYAQRWQQWGAVAVKLFIVYQILWLPLKGGWSGYQAVNAPAAPGPFRAGFYDVRQYVVNHDTIPAASADTLRWKDVIIDNALAGSVNTRDGVFWQRYRRGYFRYKPDTTQRLVSVWKISTIPRDSTFLFTMRYEVPDTAVIRFHAKIRDDSIHVELARVARHFQLTERQFHWLSEYNR
jgi:multidrug transporter EmrE-like cation transporter